MRSDLRSTRLAPSIDDWTTSKRNADTWFGSLELANQWGRDSAYLTPFLAYDFVNYKEKGYTETGNLIDMTVGKQNVDAYVQTLGARLGTKYVNRHGSLVNPILTMCWIHDYGKGTTRTTGYFNEISASPFTVVGTSRNKNRALLGLHINTAVSRSLTLFGRYDGEFAKNYHSQNFQAGMSLDF